MKNKSLVGKIKEVGEKVIAKMSDSGEVVSEEKAVEPTKKVKAPTERSSPWKLGGDAMHLDHFRLPKRHAGFRPRWVDKHGVDRKREEGWIVANRKDYGIGKEFAEMGQKESAGTTIERKGMILMEIPEQWARDREDHYREITRNQSEDAQQSEDLHNVVKGATGSVTVTD